MNPQPQQMEVPPVITPPRRSVWWLAVALLGVALACLLFAFNPTKYGFYPRCMFYAATGWYCPGCGGLRATHALLHGHLLTALHDNPLYVLSLPFLAYYMLRCAVCWIRKQPMPSLAIKPRWITALTILLIVFTILRNIPVAPFTWLAPLP